MWKQKKTEAGFQKIPLFLLHFSAVVKCLNMWSFGTVAESMSSQCEHLQFQFIDIKHGLQIVRKAEDESL